MKYTKNVNGISVLNTKNPLLNKIMLFKHKLDNANEIYGASLIYTDEMLTEVSNLINDAYTNMKSDFELIIQAMEEKLKTLEENKTELMNGLSEMDAKERSQQILEIGQLLSNELFNARMNSHKNPDMYDDGSMQLTFDLKTEAEMKILETQQALADKNKELDEVNEAAKETEKALEKAKKKAKEKDKALAKAEEEALLKDKELERMAKERDALIARMAELEKGAVKNDGEALDTAEEDDEEYEIVYVDEDELEDGEEYEIVYVDEDELLDGEEYEIEYVDEEDESSKVEEAAVKETEPSVAGEISSKAESSAAGEISSKAESSVKKEITGQEKASAAREVSREEESSAKEEMTGEDEPSAADKDTAVTIKKVEDEDDNIVPMIPHFNKSQKIATVPSEQIAKMASAMKNDKKYSGVISRAVSEREKAEAAAAVSVEDDDIKIRESSKSKVKRDSNSPHRAEMKIEEKYDITEF